jgi:hypothetical protein
MLRGADLGAGRGTQVSGICGKRVREPLGGGALLEGR